MPGVELTGRQVLDNVFGLRNVDSWSMFVVTMAYVFGFRFMQYVLLAVQTGTLPSFMGSASKKPEPVVGASAGTAVENAPAGEYKDIKKVSIVEVMDTTVGAGVGVGDGKGKYAPLAITTVPCATDPEAQL